MVLGPDTVSVLVIRLGAVLASNHPELIRHFPGSWRRRTPSR